jgi:hypothetical protein
MVNSHDSDGMRSVFEPVDDAIGTSPGRPVPLQLVAEWLSDLFGCFEQRTYQELDDRCGHAVGKSGQRALGRTGERKLPRGHFARYLARNSSAVTTSPWSISDSASRMSSIAAGLERTARVSSRDSRSSRAEDYGGRTPVAGEDHAIVLLLDSVHDL